MAKTMEIGDEGTLYLFVLMMMHKFQKYFDTAQRELTLHVANMLEIILIDKP